ncbi:MAG: hypothetical protein LQ344_001399 [Seirophora lacunosa]|nr:MAG: hypothetical protein LQ344_001399 [Seirophora lacunosa]
MAISDIVDDDIDEAEATKDAGERVVLDDEEAGMLEEDIDDLDDPLEAIESSVPVSAEALDIMVVDIEEPEDITTDDAPIAITEDELFDTAMIG